MRTLVFTMIALCFGLQAMAQATGPAEFLQSYLWHVDHPQFGGFSGLELSDDGNDLVTLSDRTSLWRAHITRDAQGRITAVAPTENPITLHDYRDREMTVSRGDSEGLALAPDGGVYVSFEGDLPRVDHYAKGSSRAGKLPRAVEFKNMQANASLEALAVDQSGALYTLPERSGRSGLAFPVFELKNNRWSRPFSIPREGEWQAVGADFGPDGRLYLLERDFWGLLGFLTRVQVFDVKNGKLSGGEVLLQTTAGHHDNLEGLSVWRDAAGYIRLTMISDDNFRKILQRTEIVEYRLPK
ncbi:esterase-like activity of phytase family protein [Thioclava sp. 'Guangxiensis']|uniref:esterase-like activity of phytase family protein n=1 Tax=Thioclava sp. 'Guangxiensis' TaxID=3149044 RepID=UPI003877CF1E